MRTAGRGCPDRSRTRSFPPLPAIRYISTHCDSYHLASPTTHTNIQVSLLTSPTSPHQKSGTSRLISHAAITNNQVHLDLYLISLHLPTLTSNQVFLDSYFISFLLTALTSNLVSHLTSPTLPYQQLGTSPLVYHITYLRHHMCNSLVLSYLISD